MLAERLKHVVDRRLRVGTSATSGGGNLEGLWLEMRIYGACVEIEVNAVAHQANLDTNTTSVRRCEIYGAAKLCSSI